MSPGMTIASKALHAIRPRNTPSWYRRGLHGVACDFGVQTHSQDSLGDGRPMLTSKILSSQRSLPLTGTVHMPKWIPAFAKKARRAMQQ
jgi:hypothetical protein